MKRKEKAENVKESGRNIKDIGKTECEMVKY
jgi:hypothetical protein